MSLGQKIYEERTARNFSQNDLADLLDVSRQSVSKWETDAAVPELDKLIKICDLFDITLDELTGRSQRGNTITVTESSSVFTPTKAVGCILFFIAFTVGALLFLFSEDAETFYLFFPVLLSLFVCGLICICLKNDIGYWCTWAALAPVCILSFHIVSLPILTTAGIFQVIVCVIMGFVANKKFKDRPVKTGKTKTVLLILGDLLGASVYLAVLILAPLDWISTCIINYVTYSALALLLTYNVCYVRSLKIK